MTQTVIVHNIPIGYQHLLFTELAARGLDFEVLFTASRSAHRIETPGMSGAAYRYRIGFDGLYESAPRLRSFAFVVKSLQAISPATVIIGGWSDAADWAAWLWANARRKPVILWMESTEADHSRRFWKEALKRIFVSRCRAAHVYGTRAKDYLQRLGMPGDRIVTGRAVVDLGRFAPGPPPHNMPRVLLYVGRFTPEKNLAVLLRALRLCWDRGGEGKIVLSLVGYGADESYLRSLAGELRIRSGVKFAGAAMQAELPAHYQAADAFVLPSTSEPWGLVVNEAMLSGLPAIVSETCGCAPDLIVPETGWTFSPSDESGLADLLLTIADLPSDVLERMGAAARRRALRYSPRECARTVIETIEQAAGQPSARAAAVQA